MTARQVRTRLSSIAFGLVSTAATAGAYAAGWLDWLEHLTLDLRFRYCNSITADPRIQCVDIDDSSLSLAATWPWPRDWQAGIVQILHELGAASILVDLNWVEPQPLRVELPADADVAADLLHTELDPSQQRYPDLALRAAVAAAGNAFLAVLFRTDADPSATADAGPNNAHGPSHADIRRWIAQNRVNPLAVHEWWERFYYSFSGEPIVNDTPTKALLRKRLLEVLGYEATMRGNFAELERVRAAAQPVAQIEPTHYLVAQAARGFGFVVTRPDRDGVLRRQLLLVEHEGRVLPQLALAVACDAMKVRPDDVRAEPGRLRIARRDGGAPLDIQLDAEGRMLIPWLPGTDYRRHFGHTPAGPFWQVLDRRSMIAQNERRMRDTLERALHSIVDDPDAYAARLERLKRAEQYAHEARLGASPVEARAAAADYDRLRAEVAAFESGVIERLRARRQALATQPYAPNESEIDHLELVLRELDSVAAIARANRDLQQEVDGVLERLRPAVRDRICLLGYTASTVADMTPTPTSERTPGVMAHASIINGLLTGRTVRWTSAATNQWLTAAGGLLATLLGALRRPRENIAFTLLAAAGFVGIAAWVFRATTIWVALTPVVAAMLLSLMSINAYQYIFVDRERRQLASALGQFTSREIARQVAENPELCRRAETREVTAMFTDLQGFTSISEQIGAERTQRVLNVCLGRFTEVMLRHEAMVNKFIGDGVFAFWNPVIYPQPDNALLACETAVDLLHALRELVREQAARGGDEAFQKLVLRVGVATGSAVVGPCGSEQKYDYTCIGDSVNVAARLESANKFFGTRVLVSGATRDAVDGRFAFRPLGGVQVKGKSRGVPVFELLGRAGSVADELLAYADRFAAAIAAFQRRDFAAARRQFAECATARPDDLAAQVYLDAAARLEVHDPGPDWNGAVELTEK